jgi:enoyl-CoA hydratase/carnithine racemase
MGIVQVEDRGPVRHIVMMRAEKRNALNMELVDALGEAFKEAEAAPGVQCVVIRGDGPVFCAGIDLTTLTSFGGGTEALRPVRRRMIEAWNRLEEMQKPVICQIQGACVGAGAELALAADFRVMAEDAFISIPEVKYGLIPDVGGSSRLPAVVGLGRAKDIIMTARAVGADEAERIGLATRVAPAADLQGAVETFIGELLANVPLAVGMAKGVLDAAAKPALAQTLATEITTQQALVTAAMAGQAAAESQPADDTAEEREPELAGR